MVRSQEPLDVRMLDLGFCGMDEVIAAYLVVGPEGPVLIETGPGSTVPKLKQRLAEQGYRPSDVGHVLVTHIHLDHAGAAGWWTQQGARVYVHRVGAPHLIDPARLLKSATRIYGDMMDRLWGETLPARKELVTAVDDGDLLEVGGLRIEALDTPGHASHHHTYQLGEVAFTGDVSGIRLPGQSFIALPTPPPDFDLEAWCESVDRIAERDFETIYPTHYGPVDDPGAHLAAVRQLVVETAEFVRQRMEKGLERDDIVREYMAWNRARASSHGVATDVLPRYESTNPSGMSVDGVLRYWHKRETR